MTANPKTCQAGQYQAATWYIRAQVRHVLREIGSTGDGQTKCVRAYGVVTELTKQWRVAELK
jgi:hypothetical protein